MSNTLAIAVTTAVIESRIRTLFTDGGLSGLNVEARLPRGDDPDDGTYLQAYRIAPNPTLRGLDLPTRRPDGTLVQRPRLAIDIDYAVAFVGDAATYMAERMAGLVLTDFHANPELTTTEIQDYLTGLAADHPLRNADLGDQLERVKLTVLPLSLEDLSRVWGLGNQSWYALTVAFHASVIILDADVQPTAGLPVLTPGIHVTPTVGPRITAIESSERDLPVAVLDATPAESLVVRGHDLRSDSTWLRIGGELVEVPDSAFAEGRIELPLVPALSLAAGVTSVEVLHRVALGGPPDPWRVAAVSNALPVTLLPSLAVPPGAATNASTPGSIDVRLFVAPLPDADQDVTLLLDLIAGSPPVHVSSSSRRIDAGQLVFTLPRPTPGTYLVRLRIDGATTAATPDGDGLLAQPQIEVPAP
ncbi:MAG: DUF4255 domain-containing protein [Nannocystaceae bacterium]